MRRDLDALQAERFDVLVAGGGIVGACVARDAALRGLRVALVEKEDFGSGASGNNLKIVHGGFRYLGSLDFRRSRRSAGELRTWLRVAPHLVETMPVLVPIGRPAFPGPRAYRLALRVYEMLTGGAGGAAEARTGPSGAGSRGPEPRIPRGTVLSPDRCREIAPWLEDGRLTGGALFHDGLVRSPERAVLEVIESACEAGAVPVNHAELTAVDRAQDGLRARVRDGMAGGELEVRSRLLVNATGAGAWRLAAELLGVSADAGRGIGVGLNLVLAVPPPSAACAAALAREPEGAIDLGRRYVFVVPWGGLTMVGTAYFPSDPVPRGPGAGWPEPRSPRGDGLIERRARAFLEVVNRSFAGLSATPADVRRVHVGLVPLRTGSSKARLEDRPALRNHRRDGFPGAITVVTEKFTTARALAERATSLLFRELGRAVPPARTADVLLPGSAVRDGSAVEAEVRQRFGGRLDEGILRHLFRTYGVRAAEVLDLAVRYPRWGDRLHPAADVIRGQLYWGVEREMALTAADLLERRTELGARGLAAPALEVARRVAERASGRRR